MTEFFTRFRTFLALSCLATVLLLLCLVGTYPASAHSNGLINKHTTRLALPDGPTIVNLKDYGAHGDGVSDDGPALQLALNALAGPAGGRLLVPAGHYLLQTPVVFSAGISLSIEGVPSATAIDVDGNGSGLDLTSEFIIASGEANDAIVLSGLEKLLVKDVAFVGVPDVFTDARVVLSLSNINEATIQHCEFYGLASLVPQGAIVNASRTSLRLEQTAFLGCAGNSATQTSIVQNVSWIGVSVADCKFVDYGLRDNFFSKTPLAPPYAWIMVGNAAPVGPTSPRREASLKNVFLDEGGYFAIAVRPDLFEPSYPPYDINVYLSRLYVNVTNLAADGIYIYGVRNVFIDRSHFGWSHHADHAINLTSVGDAVLDLIDCSNDATRIRTLADRVTVINSVYSSLDSPGPYTRVISTDTPEEDAAQYVQQRYMATLGHDPDPAGHYFWTDRLLRCEDDGDCVAETATALTVYLINQPPANFSTYGKIVDENGVPIGGARVSLTGSQTVAMETDASGNFAFSNLPTAGNYTLTATKNHYNFGTRTFITVTSDQPTNIAGTLRRHSIAGRVVKQSGAAIAGATVKLSGTEMEQTTTDDEGYYNFPDLEGGGDYVVAVTRNNYTFAVSSLTFHDLSADQQPIFEGTLLRYVIDGLMTREDGTPLNNVTVNLGGGLTSTTATDATGHYSFTVDGDDDYSVDVSRPNYSFEPASRTFANLSGNQSASFTGSLMEYMISGEVLMSDGTVLSGVTISVNGLMPGTALSDDDGYSFTLPAEGTYTLTPTKPNYSFSPSSTTFNNLSGDQLHNFTAELNPGVPVLLSASDPTRALAVDSLLRTTEPFKLTYDYPWSTDQRTRLMLFARHFDLTSAADTSDLTVSVEDSTGRKYALRVEYAGKVEGFDWLNCIIVRLSDDLTDVGDVLLRISYRGSASEPLLIGVGHIGSNPSSSRSLLQPRN